MDESNYDNSEWTLVQPKSKLCYTASKIPPQTPIIAKGDSGASNHYFALQDKDVLDDETDTPGIAVTLPDSTTLRTVKQAHLPFHSKLSTTGTKTEIFPHLNHILISLGQLCDDGCIVTLDKDELIAVKQGELVMKGIRSTAGDGLWDIPIPQSNTSITPTQCYLAAHSMNVILRKDKTKHDLVTYLHAACFSPTRDTFIKAIKLNFFTTWPGLTADLVRKHLPTSIHTVKAHIKQERQGLQSTKPTVDLDTDDMFPSPDTTPVKTNDVIYAVCSTSDRAFMDLCGRFPFASSRGNEYILIAYHYDSNAIIGTAVKNRQAATLTTAWRGLHNIFAHAGLAPKTWVLDNETSQTLQLAMTKKKTKFQLVPPNNHRANAAERAIQTFKSHFKAGLASVDPEFPISEWDRLLDQCFLTLNLLRGSRINPNLSAYAQIFGQFDFNATPLAPPGTKVVIHNKPNTRQSWDLHGSEGWYIGPSLHYYRCAKCFLPKSRREINSDTVTFIPAKIEFPSVSVHDFIKQAATDLITLLTNPPSNIIPTLEAGDPTRNALLRIAAQFNRTTLKDNELNVLNNRTTAAAAALIQNDKKQRPLEKPQQSLQDALARLTRVLKSPKPHPKRQYEQQPSFKSRAAEALLANHLFSQSINHMYHPVDGHKMTLDELLTGDMKDVWVTSLSNEIGRLTQGNIHGVRWTDTMEFIFRHEVPDDRKVTYANFVCDYRPTKDDPYRIRLVVGGDKLEYDQDAGSPAASILETKLLINSIISDAKKGAKFMSADVKDFFLASPMGRPEYMRIPAKYLPADIIAKYILEEKISNGYVYVKINKGMYGLKQAAVLAYDHLVQNLKPYGYAPIPHTLGLWKHETRPITFCLCVDDFGIKYFDKEDVNHLLDSLGKNYKYTTDWSGRNFCGLTFTWNYEKAFVDVSMPKYVDKVLHKFQHKKPKHPVCSPFAVTPWKPFKPGDRQYAPTPDTAKLLDKKGTTRVQSIVGSILYYARALDNTLLPALNTIAASQSKPTKTTKKQCNRLLDYLATYPNVYVWYHASDMQLVIDSDAAYLVEPQARSRIAGYFQMNTGNLDTTFTNGAIHIECKTLRHVVASLAEAETAGVFHNAQIAVPIRYVLEKMGHPQRPTLIKTDNATTFNFIHDNINQKKSKSWDMRYFWLRDRQQQKQFRFHWESGTTNKADYYTKHHTEKHHKAIRATYVRDDV